MGIPWSKAEQLALYSQIGSAGDAKLKRAFKGRSMGAIRARAYRLFGSSSRTRGSQSLAEVMRETGFGRSQLLRAQEALQQRWHRTRVGGAYMISLEQVQAMTDWLMADYWCKKHKLKACLWCTTTTRPHRNNGLCGRCAGKYRRLSGKFRIPCTVSCLIYDAEFCLKRSRCVTLERMIAHMQKGLAVTESQLMEFGQRFGR